MKKDIEKEDEKPYPFLKPAIEKAHKKFKLSKKIQKEIVLCLSNVPAWLDDDGEVFMCKFCRKIRPVKLKSQQTIGQCKFCTSEE